jgi:hypothetical protein
MAAGACNAAHPECATQVFAVVPGKTYRFRIASVTSLSALNFEIEVRTLPLNLISDQHFISFNYPACGFDLSCQKWHCEIPSAITIQIAVFTPSRVHDMVTKRITIII